MTAELKITDFPILTLAEWKRRLKPGMKMLCTHRWYWEASPEKRPKSGTQLCEVLQVRSTQMIYSTPDCPKSWLQFPKASDLIATTNGFEMYFPADDTNKPGLLMSRYEYVPQLNF